MLPFHEHLAQVGLAAIAEYGFVLAGGYAISANGIGDRPSDDVDLFTNVPDPDRFAEAAATLRDALRAEGLEVVDLRIRPTFVDLQVHDPDGGESSELQLGLDFRSYPPAQLAIGPVLDVRDAVGGKFSALWSRGEARDFIDVDAIVQSGRFTRAQLLAIGDEVEAMPMERPALSARFLEAARHSEQIYARYGVGSTRRQQIIARFIDWAVQINPPRAIDGGVEPPVGQDWTPSVRRHERRREPPQAPPSYGRGI